MIQRRVFYAGTPEECRIRKELSEFRDTIKTLDEAELDLLLEISNKEKYRFGTREDVFEHYNNLLERNDKRDKRESCAFQNVISELYRSFHDSLGIVFKRDCPVTIGDFENPAKFLPYLHGSVLITRKGTYNSKKDCITLNPVGSSDADLFHESVHCDMGNTEYARDFRKFSGLLKRSPEIRKIGLETMRNLSETGVRNKMAVIEEGLAYAIENGSYGTFPDFSSYVDNFSKKEDFEEAYRIFGEIFKTRPYPYTVELAKDVINESYNTNRDALEILKEKFGEMKENQFDYKVLLSL